MWRVVGDDKRTGKTVEVAVADNEAELRIILREESRNYRNVRAVGMSVVVGERKARAGA